MVTRNTAKRLLQQAAITQGKAAETLKRSRTHLNLVLNGKRESKTLLNEIEHLVKRRAA
ncbi:MAG: hypothetical protein V1929_00210 [bacterium]